MDTARTLDAPPVPMRLAAMFGLLGVATLAAAILLAVAAYTGTAGERYSPLNHFVSELGEVGVSPNAEMFNLGLILGGLCMAASTFCLALTFRRPFGYIFAFAGLFSGISGTLVGLYPMNDFPPHILTALLFFTSGWITVALFSVHAYRSGIFPRGIALFGLPVFLSFHITLALASQTPLELMVYPGRARPDLWAVTIFEWLTITLVLVWMAALSFSAARKRP